ncbi:MAG TPA: aminotransferase class V-fold PLP-dependent enzyme [Kofleriaceae bacterium]|nr:aminotransferase class V-fold PLP-dependent enzyme [Kofleriaceae bacterium]
MSTNRRIYLDYNATAPLVPAARAAIAEALGAVGNPSSVHAHGRRVRDLIERARNHVAQLAGRPREQVVFTSGGTEANTLGVLGLARLVEGRGGPRVVASAKIDHPSLRGAVASLVERGWTVVESGTTTQVGLVTVSAVNHELGTLPDLAAIASAARGAGALVHVDAVQAAGKLDLQTIDADAIAISSHKIGGPQGVGALVIALDEALPLVDGGHQERGRRPGTENTLGIVGFGAAAAEVDLAAWPRVAELGARLEAGLLALDGVRIHGADTARIGGTINAGFAGALGESIVIGLDLAGISASTGAACTSGSIQASPVLLALGLPEAQAKEGVRFSLGRATTADEIDEVLARLPGILARARLR